MTIATVADALDALGQPGNRPPEQPVLYGPKGTLVTLGVVDAEFQTAYHGVWIDESGPQFLGAPPPSSPFSAARQLSGPSKMLYDLYVLAIRSYYRRIAELDERVAELHSRGKGSSLENAWTYQRQNSLVRTQFARASAALAELVGPLEDRFPGFAAQAAALQGTLAGVREVATGVQAMVSDLIQLRSAEESNRLNAAANELARQSNRLAAYTNTSNVRMLGITYIALLLALIAGVVLIPNTGATILGMPSAAWVPGFWVDVILAVLAVIPIAVVFSRPWVRRMLHELGEFSFRTEEGLADLPEVTPAEVTKVQPPKG